MVEPLLTGNYYSQSHMTPILFLYHCGFEGGLPFLSTFWSLFVEVETIRIVRKLKIDRSNQVEKKMKT